MECKLLDFQIYDEEEEYVIQMFGKDEEGKSYSITVEDYKPFFYVKVGKKWTESTKRSFVHYLKDKFGSVIYKAELLDRKKLYGFDAGEKLKFVELKFNNHKDMRKVSKLWYCWKIVKEEKEEESGKRCVLNRNGHTYKNTKTYIYESKIPPLLRFFHIQNISPSGWIRIENPKKYPKKETICDVEYRAKYTEIIPLRGKETPVPIKICSFDIEASSSHGDFPLPKKTYEKLSIDILNFWDEYEIEDEEEILTDIVLTAFGYDTIEGIHEVYPKCKITEEELRKLCKMWLKMPISEQTASFELNKRTIRRIFEDEEKEWRSKWRSRPKKRDTVIDLLNRNKFDRGDKLEELDKTLTNMFPPLKGDMVTFIGSTFKRLGEKDSYLNHCIVLGGCGEVSGAEIDSYSTEEECLLAWRDLIQRENPDVIIGYNICGFDYKFMLGRTEELGCRGEFLMMSRNIDESCEVKKTSIKIASGVHELEYIQSPGRIPIDLYNYFRREYNLSSYKLDNVASHFIGDSVLSMKNEKDYTNVRSKNLMGLVVGNYVCFELTSHSTEMYENGKKYKVVKMLEDGFMVEGEPCPEKGLKIRWCLAKDDVTPQDIFRLSKGTDEDRAIIAKYCIMDCILTGRLMEKNDVLTGFSEIASICSIPISFVVLRGQGIKLLSFIAKKCREKDTLLPDINKGSGNDWYEGAICLKPKCDLYLDNPIACVDYASLYPSSMISENISHDSKVWTKEYDLDGVLIKRTGTDVYDNLDGYEYVDITYDTYKWQREHAKGKEIKVRVGKKICRYAQYPDDKKAIMPSILTELLSARKATRKLIKYKTVTTKSGEKYSGILKKTEGHHEVNDERIRNEDVLSVEDTYDDFMKNVFDKRQQGYKITANSLYGQCGAKTSAFYDMDIAASTTATGRKLLLYGKRVIEEVYKNRICETKRYGKVRTNADCIYGDSVTSDTPIFLKHIKTGKICFKQIDDIGDEWFPYEGFKMGEKGRNCKEQCMVEDYEVWTSGGWSSIYRLIRHKTDKKLYRITTHTGTVDVTEDHSLLDKNHRIIKPREVVVGMHLLHNYPKFKEKKMILKDVLNYIKTFGYQSIEEKKAFIYGFFYGDGSCGKYNCPSGLKYSWALNNKDLELCVILQSLLEEIYEDSFKILDTIKSSGVYKVVPMGRIKRYVEEYRPLFYNKDRYKKIPEEILNALYNVRYAYFAGYYAADGNKCKNQNTKNIGMSNKGKIGSVGLFYLAKSLGWNVSLNTRKDKRDIINFKCSSNKMRKDPRELKKVEYIGNSGEGYVYDIETETGDFNTGFPLIVKNTDSCFFTFNLEDMNGKKIRGKKALEITIELACEVGKLASMMLKSPHDLEYEKTLMPFALLSKKRYVGMLYEFDPEKCKRKSMGIVLKRRDNAPIVKDVYGGIIDILMKEKDVKKAIEYAKSCMNKLINEEYPLKKLIITKSLRGFYKNPKQIAHKVLADRIGKRDPGNKPSVGSRIPFVYIQTKGKKKLQGERIETPDYVEENNLKLDYMHYITNQILKPILQIFALPRVLKDIPSYNRKRRQIEIKLEYISQTMDLEKYEKKKIQIMNKEVKDIVFEDCLRKARNIKNGNKAITDFF